MNGPFRLGVGWGDGYYNGSDTALAPANVAGTNFEVRVSLHATHEVDHSLMFPMASTNGTIGLFCRLISTGWSQLDITAPSAPYTFGTFPLLPTTITATRVGTKIQLTWAGGGELQTRSNLSTGTWAPVPGATSGILIDPTLAAGGYYQVKQ
jgi:hypothetical protein